MTDEPRRPFRLGTGPLAEMFMIVVSILFAFALDSWWDRRSDATAYRELTQRLHADFLETRNQLRASLVRGDSLATASRALMAALADPSAVGADSLRTLFPSILRPVEWVSAPPSYRAAVSSGLITIIDDPGLFRALAAVDQAQDRMDTYSRLAADVHYLGALADLERTLGSLVVLTSRGAPSRFVPADYLALVSRPEVYSASRVTAQIQRNLLTSLRNMDSAMSAVIEQLEISAAGVH